MSDVKKSALWALISLPITLFGAYNLVGLSHAGGFWGVPFVPALLACSFLAPQGSPDWWFLTVGFVSQYLGYFLFAWIIYKLKQTRVENIAKEQGDKSKPESEQGLN